MHIHLPKPLHGWKELLNEIFVIVVGVLIALGFEQVVEELHWQHKVHEGEERIRSEASINAAFAAEQITTQPCVAAQVAELVRHVQDVGERNVPVPVRQTTIGPRVLMIGSRPYQDGVWTTLVQDGTVTHFSPARQKLIGLGYSAVESIRNYTATINALQGDLVVLADPVALDGSARVHILQQLHAIDAAAAIRALIAAQMIDLYDPGLVKIALNGSFC